MDRSFNLGFIGVGQGGCRIANTFRKMGYENCVFLNTAKVDLDGLDAPEEQKLRIGDHPDGAGKRSAEGRRAAEVSNVDIRTYVRGLVLDGVEKIFVCIGSGGGTGSGAGPAVVSAVQEIAGRVAVIATLPASRELVSDAVKQNSRELLSFLCDEAEENKLFPLIVLDNELIKNIAPIRSFRTMWDDGNEYGCKILDIFNVLSSQPTFLTSIDKNDLKTVLDRPGTMFMGRSINKYSQDKTHTKRAIQGSFNRGIFLHSDSPVENSDCAIIMKVPSEVLDMNVQVFDMIMDAINKTIDDVPGGHVHRGFYENHEGSNAEIFTITIGDKPPRSAIDKRLT